ncbi:MAG: CapA family protein [candidate division KSB1 bacterium]|nr:CapA family protein [candidate division KSB1 bacterium]
MIPHNLRAIAFGFVLSAAIALIACSKASDENKTNVSTNDSLGVYYRDSAPFYIADTGRVEVAAAGDLMLGSWIVDKVKKEGVDAPFEYTRQWLSAADVAVVNLEAPFADSGRLFVEKQYTFKVPTFMVEGMVNAGIDVVTLANNHIMDYGCDGLMSTIATLDRAGIRYCGGGQNLDQACAPVIMEVRGLRLAFIGLTTCYPDEFWATPTRCGTCNYAEPRIEEMIRLARQQADVVIVNIHWGVEKSKEANSLQIERAHRLIDAGVDVIIGHHPHVLQGFEIYKDKLIAYSLGNYIFGSLSENAHTAAILRLFFTKEGWVEAQIVPLHVYNAVVQFQPRPLTGSDRQKLIAELQTLSLPLNNGKKIIDDEGTILPMRNPILQ